MKTAALLFITLFAHSAVADPFFTGNPWSAIPPGCITRPDLQAELYGDHSAVVFDGQAYLRSAANVNSENDFNNYLANTTPANVRILRVACAEPDRSALFVEHRISPHPSLEGRQYLVPNYSWYSGNDETSGWMAMDPERQSRLAGNPPGDAIQMTFGDYTGGWYPAEGFVWTYVLDSPGPLANYPESQPISAPRYNQEVMLQSDQHVTFDDPVAPWIAPATSEFDFGAVRMPLTGRHTGLWHVAGARDQGITLSFSNRVPPAGMEAAQPERSPVLLFLAWYTFDATGQMLWLTGAGEFAQGADRVDLEFVKVSDGEFLGTRQANRVPAGSATLTSKSCANLVLEFDLSAIGLGTGSVELDRVHELEIAGYNCRDHDARRTAAFGTPAEPTSH